MSDGQLCNKTLLVYAKNKIGGIWRRDLETSIVAVCLNWADGHNEHFAIIIDGDGKRVGQVSWRDIDNKE